MDFLLLTLICQMLQTTFQLNLYTNRLITFKNHRYVSNTIYSDHLLVNTQSTSVHLEVKISLKNF
jgi:hypothetical protein